MLFKPNTIVFIQRSGLLVAGRKLSPARLDFPDDLVRNLEVVLPSKLREACRQFFTDHELHGKRFQLVLDYSVVFEKSIELDKSGKPDLIMEGFVEAMPFEKGKRACLALQTGDVLRLFATNAELYQTVVTAIDGAGAGAVEAITPISAYNLGDGERTIRTAMEFILKHSDISRQADFRDVAAS